MASLAAWQALGQGQRALGYPPTYGRINPPFTGGYDELGLAHQALVRWADRAKLNHAFGSLPSPQVSPVASLHADITRTLACNLSRIRHL